MEGFELEVIRGAHQVLQDRKVNIIQFERHTDDMRYDTFPIIHEILDSMGFEKVEEIKHPVGDFYEVLYALNRDSFRHNTAQI